MWVGGQWSQMASPLRLQAGRRKGLDIACLFSLLSLRSKLTEQFKNSILYPDPQMLLFYHSCFIISLYFLPEPFEKKDEDMMPLYPSASFS